MHITGSAHRAKCDRKGFRLLAIAAIFAIVGASCGGGDSTNTESEPSPVAAPDSGEGQTESKEGPPESTVNISAELARVDLPEGLRLSDANNQAVTVNGVGYLLAATAEGMVLVAVTDRGASATDALIAGGASAEVWNSGKRIVMTGVDGVGNLVVLSSLDGESFTEALIPIPAKYADADVWQTTSLIGDALGVADINDDILIVAALGINWPSDLDVVAQHAYTVSEEVGDATRFASTIRQVPQGDGDFLYTFEVGGEVVFESLGSDAGLEPGYREAFRATRDTDTSTHGAWIISGSTATQAPDLPFSGGLDNDVRLKALYPVDNGAAAVVVDFSFEDPGGNENAFAGRTVLVSGHPDAKSLALLWLFDPEGRAVLAGDSAKIPGMRDRLPDKVVVDADVEGGSYQMLTLIGDEVSLHGSDSGLDWSEPPLTLSMTLDIGVRIQMESTGLGTFIMVWPATTEGGEPRLFRSDGFTNEDGHLVEIDYETGAAVSWLADNSRYEDPDPPFVFEKDASRVEVWRTALGETDGASTDFKAFFMATY